MSAVAFEIVEGIIELLLMGLLVALAGAITTLFGPVLVAAYLAYSDDARETGSITRFICLGVLVYSATSWIVLLGRYSL